MTRFGIERPNRRVENPVPEPTHAKSGFTLVELVIVALVVALVSAIAMPQLGLGRVRADGAAREVMSSLMAAQTKAILRQHDVLVEFDTADSRITVTEDQDNDGVRDGSELATVITIPDGIRLTRASAPAHSMGGGPVSFSSGRRMLPTVTFHRNGSASESGIVYIAPSAFDGGAEPESAHALIVERSTGRVTCITIQSGSWDSTC